MLKRRFKIIDGGKKVPVKKQREQQIINDIMSGKFGIYILDSSIAKAIVRWCDEEENPIQFFLQCLEKIGVQTPVKMANIVQNNEYYSIILRDESGIKRLDISIVPKQFLRKEELLNETIELYQHKLIIQKKGAKIEYLKSKSVEIILGNNIKITLENIEWSNYKDLYHKSLNLLEELKLMDEDLLPYYYYIKTKEIISKYYNLDGVEINVSNLSFCVTVKDGKLRLYKEDDNGITIRKYKGWQYRRYCSEGVELILENDVLKCSGIPIKQLQKYLDITEILFEEIESFKF